jgi:restriction endonuclease S subunit
MPETLKQTQVFRFDQMAVQVKDKVEPAEAEVDRYVGLEHIDPETLKIRRWGKTSDVESTKIIFKSRDIIFGKRRAYQRKLAVADFDGICSAHAMVLRPKTDVVLEEFLPFFMQSDIFMDRAVKISVGGLSPTINWRDLAAEKFSLPSLEDQRQIAEVLQACRRTSESFELSADRAVHVEYAFLRDAFGTRYGQPTAELAVEPLANLATIQTGLAKGRRPDSSTMEMPYLRVANVKDGHLDLEEIKHIVVEREKMSRYRLSVGDVLMTEGGDLDKLGRGTVWQGEIDDCLHQNHIFAVRTDPARLDPWYLAAIARSPYGRSFFLQSAKRSSNLASVNKTQVSRFRIPLMAVTEQQRWLKEYQSIRSGEAELRSRAARSSMLARVCLKGVLSQ